MPEYASSVGANPLYKGNVFVNADIPLYKGSGAARTTITIQGTRAAGTPAVAGDGFAFSQFTFSGGLHGSAPGMWAIDLKTGQSVRLESGSVPDDALAAASKDGTVVFKSFDDNGQEAITVGNTTGRIIGSIPSQISGFGAINGLTISDNNTIVATGAVGNGQSAIFTQNSAASSGGSLRITVSGSNFSKPVASAYVIAAVQTGSTPSAQSVTVHPRDVKTGQSSGRRSWSPLITNPTITLSADQNSPFLAICDGRSIVIGDTSQADLWTSDANAPAPQFASVVASPTPLPSLIQVGDSLGGSTVAGLSLSPQSFYGGELYFFAQLANGETGIFAATVPEPVTLGLAGLALPLLARRRR